MAMDNAYAPTLSAVRGRVDEACVRIARLATTRVESLTKSDASPVTRADIESNRILKAGLQPLTPGSAWFSEEDLDDACAPGKPAWIVDPLDGTKELLKGIKEVAVSVALVDESGSTVLAMVVNPLNGEGGGWSVSEGLHFWGGLAGQSARSESLADAAVAVSRSELGNGSVAHFLSGLPGITGIGSAAYKLLLVASGRVDLVFSAEPKWEWDLAGGIALVRAARLQAVRFDGKPFHPDLQSPRIQSGFVAGEPSLVRSFLTEFGREVAEAQALIESGTIR
jgi:fructose-1,6-bisphosphatase/inositol monophosphatase family enzyme